MKSFRALRTSGLMAGVVLLTATTAACGSGSAGSPSAGSPSGGKPEVLAAFYPLQWLSERVAGGAAQVTGLTGPGVEPHDVELTPRQVASLSQARLTVYVKGIQPAVDEAVEQHAADRGFDAAAAVTPLTAGPSHAEEGHSEGDGHDHGHEDGQGTDPHIWLDPSRLATVATALGQKMATADPAGAAGYRERAAATAKELSTLDEEFTKGLATCGTRTIVTSHAAFGYLAERYKFKQVAISGIDPDAEPSPGRLAEVAEIARREKVTTIFTETLVNPKVADVLAQEVGAKTSVLDPVESKPSTGDYLSAMRQNLTALRAAMECS
ncbi:metal ABC transporter substrate-binding protein [Sinosporangium siamense]|uniref:Zinc ABC transporter substrate-binding protein n=1 Tax=Sinosporangium siamense TaxID=1367973 RepID=A0A919V9C5_9ACTN|nr:metal ABC transporter substrate-binding protein [Sinosporangium siamense]GII90004.1 zinc ABC transporter substrate-binding protein [Sinosporangium siamense]